MKGRGGIGTGEHSDKRRRGRGIAGQRGRGGVALM